MEEWMEVAIAVAIVEAIVAIVLLAKWHTNKAWRAAAPNRAGARVVLAEADLRASRLELKNSEKEIESLMFQLRTANRTLLRLDTERKKAYELRDVAQEQLALINGSFVDIYRAAISNEDDMDCVVADLAEAQGWKRDVWVDTAKRFRSNLKPDKAS